MSNMPMTKEANKTDGRRYAGLSVEERKLLRRKAFLDAGLDIFGTEGYQAATVRRVCRQAKLTDRYFYESFGSMEALFIAVYQSCMDAMREHIVEAVESSKESSMESSKEQADISVIVHAALESYFKELEDSRIARVCMVEPVGISSAIDEVYNEYIMAFARLLIEFTQDLYPHWRLSKDELLIFGLSLTGAMRQAATHWLLSDYKIKRNKLVVSTAKIFLGLFRQIESENR